LDRLADLHGWAAGGNGILTSPDHYCRLEHTPGQEIGWQVEHVYFENAPLATFTQDTPEVIVRQFFAYLAAPALVERSFGDVPLSTRHEASARVAPVRPAGMDTALVQALDRLLGPPGRPGRRR
ncbi:SPDY domain-containing protein, partial [Actinacidiphila rubida]